MPWKCIVCGWLPPLTKRIRSRSPSLARSVGPGDAAVVGPRGELHAGRELDLLLAGGDRPLAQGAAVGQLARLAPVEVAQHRVRVEAVGGVVDLAPAKAGVLAVRACRGGAVHAGMSCGSAAAAAAPCECGIVACAATAPSPRAEAEPRSLRRVSGATRLIMACLNLGRPLVSRLDCAGAIARRAQQLSTGRTLATCASWTSTGWTSVTTRRVPACELSASSPQTDCAAGGLHLRRSRRPPPSSSRSATTTPSSRAR